MTITRTVTKEVEETIRIDLRKFWTLNIVQGVTSLKVIERIDFDHYPNNEEITCALVKYLDKKVFASVMENYKLVEV